MTTPLHLRLGTRAALTEYMMRQLALFGGVTVEATLLEEAVAAALSRFAPLASRVRAFRPGQLDHLHSLQYATFLYLAGHAAWLRVPTAMLVDQLFCLNKMLHSLELHPAVDLPGSFLLSHALGAVLGNATYGEGLVVFQNVTVGRVGDNRPTIGRDVILYAGASVTGRATIGDCCVVAAGARVHNLVVPSHHMVRPGGDRVIVEPLGRHYHDLYLRADPLEE